MRRLKSGVRVAANLASVDIRVCLGSLLIAFAFDPSASASPSGDWNCPPGFTPQAGLNVNFPSDGAQRAFVVVEPKGQTGPAPVWVPMTGTVEATNWNLHVLRSGNNANLAEAGFMVIAPIRECAGQDPDLAAGPCNGPGRNGWSWTPWHDGRAPSAAGDPYKTDAGPDVRFLEAMVRCVGTKWPLDRKRLYLGGISAGGTMTNRALLFDSKFWAGGLPISGEWYIVNDDGSSVNFDEMRRMVAKEPEKIWQGRVGPDPLPRQLDPMIVLTLWGGEHDLWDCGPGVGLCSDYRPTTQVASNYFSSIPGVVHVACSATHGHMWPQVNTEAFNLWALKTLASHPKGSSQSFELIDPPAGYKCQTGRYTDHY
jgi:poly(3-hydroxybutyrate) depolymerase